MKRITIRCMWVHTVHISYFPFRTMYQTLHIHIQLDQMITDDTIRIRFIEIYSIVFGKRLDYIRRSGLFFFWVTSFSAFSFTIRSMGFGKMKTLPGHHRKRLAVDSSRHHLRPDDSHMFVVKLPPNPYYYSNTNTGHSKNAIADENTKVRMCNVYSLHTSV